MSLHFTKWELNKQGLQINGLLLRAFSKNALRKDYVKGSGE